eukprot:11210823-Lingulodinium_polyedra.AAC.1
MSPVLGTCTIQDTCLGLGYYVQILSGHRAGAIDSKNAGAQIRARGQQRRITRAGPKRTRSVLACQHPRRH